MLTFTERHGMRILFIALLIGIIAGLFVFFFPQVLSSSPHNVYFLNQNFESVKKSEIIPYLQFMQEKWLSTPIEIEARSKKFLIDKKALFLHWDLARIKKDILRAKDGVVPIHFVWDENKVREAFQFIAEKTYLPPQKATMNDNRVFHSQPGYRLNTNQAIEETKNAISQGLTHIQIESFEILPPETDTATLLTSLGINHLLSRYETSLEGKDEKTRFNIQKGANSLSGFILEKRKVFSFNQVVGPADKDDGYLETKVVVNGKLVPGYGGGICQVSSTLYNALLKTNVEIIERGPHSGYSETTSYVPPGRDAAVSYGFKDLRFRFPSQQTVIFTYVENNRLVAEIWGEKENKESRVITSRIRNIIDNGNEDAKMEVETIILLNDSIEKKYIDTYSVPANYAQVLKEQNAEIN